MERLCGQQAKGQGPLERKCEIVFATVFMKGGSICVK